MNLMKTKFLCALALILVFSGATSALAGTVTFATVDKAGKYGSKTYYGDIKSWDFSGGVKVEVTLGGKAKTETIARHLVINANLSDGADFASCPTLKNAVETQALADFQAVASDAKANEIQKEFAAWQVANILATNNAQSKKAMEDYLRAYPKGNYSRSALMRISYTQTGAGYVKALAAVAALGDNRSKSLASLALGKVYFEGNQNANAKSAFEEAVKAAGPSLFPGALTEAKSFLGRLSSGAAAIKLFDEALAVESTSWQDLRGRERARGYAYLGRGTANAKGGTHDKAYKDFIDASFWLGAYGAVEGECVLGAYNSALANSKGGKDAKKWAARATTLLAFLTENYPKLLK